VLAASRNFALKIAPKPLQIETRLLLTVYNYELVIVLSYGAIANPLRHTVWPQYHTIGIAKCVIIFQGHLRSMIFVSPEMAYATFY